MKDTQKYTRYENIVKRTHNKNMNDIQKYIRYEKNLTLTRKFLTNNIVIRVINESSTLNIAESSHDIVRNIVCRKIGKSIKSNYYQNNSSRTWFT